MILISDCSNPVSNPTDKHCSSIFIGKSLFQNTINKGRFSFLRESHISFICHKVNFSIYSNQTSFDC